MTQLTSYSLLAAGLLSLVGVVIHIFFTPIFGWARDLKNLSTVNRRSALVMNLMIIYVLLLIAVADVYLALGIVDQPTGTIVLLAVAGFWGVRLVAQLIYFNLRESLSWLFLSAYVFMVTAHLMAL